MRLTASFLIGKKTKWKQNGDSGEPLKLLKEKKKKERKNSTQNSMHSVNCLLKMEAK